MRGSRGKTRGPGPSEKSLKYRVSKQYCSGSPTNDKATKPAFNVIIGTPAKRHLNVISMAGPCWPAYSVIWILSFKKNKTTNKNKKITLQSWTPSGKMFWIRACKYSYRSKYSLMCTFASLLQTPVSFSFDKSCVFEYCNSAKLSICNILNKC